MTKSEYAAHRSVSPAMVTKWKDAGRLVLRGKLVDARASDRLLGQVQDRTRGGKRDRLVSGAADAGAAAVGGAAEDAPPAIVTATVAHKRAQTELLEARAGRELGRLVDRGQFEAATVSAAAMTQRGLMALPARLGTVIAERLGVDARAVFPILEDECRGLANDLAAAVEALAGQVESTSH